MNSIRRQENQELQEIAKIIKSLVIPHSKGIRIENLIQDFKETEGRDIPFCELGFKSYRDLLSSFDCIQIRCNQFNQELIFAKITPDTAHIQKMVSEQRVILKSIKIRPQLPSSDRFYHPINYRPIANRIDSLSNSRRVKNKRGYNKRNEKPFLHVSDINRIRNLLITFGCQGICLNNFQVFFAKMFHSEFDFRSKGFKTLLESLKSIPEVCFIEMNEQKDSFQVKLNPSLIKTRFEKSNPKCETLETANTTSECSGNSKSLNENKVKDEKKEDEFEFPKPKTINMVDTEYFPSIVVERFKQLLAQHPKGVPASQFYEEYERLTNKAMEPTEWGFYSPLEVFFALPSIFYITEPSPNNEKLFPGSEFDYILYNVNNKPHSEVSEISKCKKSSIEWNIKKQLMILLFECQEGLLVKDFNKLYSKSFDQMIDPSKWNHLNWINFFIELEKELPIELKDCYNYQDAKVFLKKNFENHWLRTCISNCEPSVIQLAKSEEFILPGDIIPQVTIDKKNICSKKWHPVLITTCANPSSIWINLKGPQHTDLLENLMQSLDFYKSAPVESCALPDVFLIPGFYCIALFPCDQSWYRVRIIQVFWKQKRVSVTFIDFGGSSIIERKNLRLMKKLFSNLPAQAR